MIAGELLFSYGGIFMKEYDFTEFIQLLTNPKISNEQLAAIVDKYEADYEKSTRIKVHID